MQVCSFYYLYTDIYNIKKPMKASFVMKKNIIIAIGFVLFGVIMYFIFRPAQPEKTRISHDMVVQNIEELGRLEVIRYNIRDIIEYEKLRTWLPNSKTALIAVGEVVACVDLTKIQEGDVIINGDSVSLVLPLPEICHFKVDHSRSRVYDVQYGFFDSHKLVDEAYREAERQIYDQALKMGIADESRKSAVKTLTPLLKMLGFNKINITFKQSAYQSATDKPNINLQTP